MKIEKLNLIPIILSIIVTFFIIWVEVMPEDSSNFVRLKLNRALYMMNYLRYEMKTKGWIKAHQANNNKITIINVYEPSHAHKASKNAYEYLQINKIIRKLNKMPVKAIATNIIISQSHKELIQDIEVILNTNISKYINTKNAYKFDNDFVETIKQKDNIILPFILNKENVGEGLLPKAMFKAQPGSDIYSQFGYITYFKNAQEASKYLGFTTTLIDKDGAVRKVPLLLRYKNNVYPSLALSIVMNIKHLKNVELNTITYKQKQLLKSIRVGNQDIKVDKHGALNAPFNRSISTIKTYSADDILHNKFNKEDIDNAIILIASNQYITPENKTKYISAPMTNIEAQASLLSALLANEVIYEPFWSSTVTLMLILSIVLILITCFQVFGIIIATIIAMIIQISLTAANTLIFINFGIILNITSPLIACLIVTVINLVFGFLLESRKKMQLKKFFSQYIPPEYLNILLANPEKYGFDGKSENLTVIFADIRNFTGISETLSANSVKSLLNEFFTPMTAIILKHGGTIDKYVGDMIMAFFGAPIANPNQHESALNCALEMLARTKKMQKHFQAQGLPKVGLSIGISSGMMNVGDMGSQFRRSYTVIGNCVNLGSRIQSATSFYGVDLIASSHTCELQDKFVFRLLDKVKLKGKKECETIYEVVGRKKSINANKLEEIQEHHQAMEAYFAQNWDLTIEILAKLLQKNPDYKPYNIFMQRAKHYKQNPPPTNWDGSYTFTEK